MHSPGANYILKKLNTLGVSVPAFHVVLGSGFKEAIDEGTPSSFKVKGEIQFTEVPGLFPSTAPGHAGKYIVIEHTASKKVGLLQVGRLHGYEGLDPREVIRTVMFTRELGTQHYFITNAAGGLDPKHAAGDVMLINDHLNLTGKNPLFGENPTKLDGTPWGPRFQDLTKLYDRQWNSILKSEFGALKLNTHEGVYVGVLGPSFETPAEVRYFRLIGGHSVGMSTVWETIALKHSGATVTAMSLISNIGAGLVVGADGIAEELDHFAILDACKSSSISILKGILLSVQKNLSEL